MQSIGGLLLAIGMVGIFASIVYMNSLDYNGPPIPAGYLVGMFSLAVGAGISVGSSVIAVREANNKNKLPQWITIAILAAGLAGYGVWEVVRHPLELPDCLCPANYYGEYPCVPCPNDWVGICHGRGTCDDGNMGSGICFCELGWDGENCDVCSHTFQGVLCNECKRGWMGEKCDVCYPGYSGPNCNVCDTGWVPETDIYGTLCRKCKPGRWGGHCKPCQECTLHDKNAVCRDNDWHEANIYNEDLCTPQGSTCKDKYGCSSNNCKGICVVGDETTGQICEFDGDCYPGECQFKQCCLEARHGNGHCKCGSMGYFGEDCATCPGFDGVYSATICTGHGTCVAEYAGNTYTGLRCECTKDGVTPFPAWSGETCSCLKNTATDTTCSKCATGSFGSQCNSCPGGSGIAQCRMHGKCSDGVSGDGTCSCDIDVKYGGLGAFKGGSCDSCLSNDFYGDNCKTCPNIQVVQCIPGLNLTEIPGVGQCVQSCGPNTCNNIGICI